MSTLFNSDNSDSDEDIKINSDYAKDYNTWRQKEELNKLKIKYEEVTTDDSSSSDDENNGNIENPQFDREFYKTLACLKKKDPCIYDKDVKFFNNIDISGTIEHADAENRREKKLKKEKTIFLRDYERKIVMEENGRFSDSEDEDNAKENAKVKMHTYTEEQQEMKDSFKHVLKEESEDTDEDTEFLKIKQKTDNDKQEEEKLYKKWLKGQKLEIDLQEQEELQPLRDFWTDPNLDTKEKFLRDYILNNKYIDKESSDVELDYDQIVHDSDNNLSEDEKNIEKQEEFEHKYNFRFEEPDQEFIKRYPRTMENLMRRKDTRRAQKRAEIRNRKEEEKQQKREELKQLKALKRKEIEEKIEKLKEITGNDDMRFDSVDFDTDFDPNEHDRKMKELFNEEYYTGTDNMKPEFPDIDEELGIENTWDDYDPNANEIDTEDMPHEESHCEDPDFNMDADYDGSQNLQSELIESTRKRKKRRRSKFATLVAKEKPKFDPKQFPSYEEYFDQYYSLDYEDIIGDLPCRFKYRKVVPNDYGLSVEEILMADDKELNKWCSLKRALQHKSENIEMQEVQSYKQKAKNETFKRKILKSLYTESDKQENRDANANEQTTNDDIGSKKRRQKKKTKNNFNVDSVIANTVSEKRNTEIVEDNTQNNSRIKNDTEQDKIMQEKNVVNKSNEKKRKNKSRLDSDGSRPKKIKMDNVKKESSRVEKVDNNIEKTNEETASVGKTTIIEKRRNKTKRKSKLQMNKLINGKRKLNSANIDSMMSLNVERLKTYGINAKKFKNKLKYGKKKF